MNLQIKRKLAMVSAYGERMVDLYFLLDLRLEVLRSFSQEQVVEPLQDSEGANVYNTLVASLSSSIVGDLYSLLLDKAPETLSVRNVWRLARSAELVGLLRHRFANGSDEGAIEFDAILGSLNTEVPALLESHLAARLTEIRHKSVAHREMQTVTVGPSQHIDVHNFNIHSYDLVALLADAYPVVRDLGAIATSTGRNWTRYRHTHKRFAADFWSRLQGRRAIEKLPEDASPKN